MKLSSFAQADRCGSVFMDHNNDSYRHGVWNFQDALPPSITAMSWTKWRKTIRIEKFHTKTVSILSFLMFEKCQFRESYPPMISGQTFADNLQYWLYHWLQIFCFVFVPAGDNRVKNDWARGGGMNIPRMRRPEDQSPTAGLMMEVVR